MEANPFGLEFTKSSVSGTVKEADVKDVVQKALNDTKLLLKDHSGVKVSQYERELTQKLYEELNNDARTKCPEGRQVWGVFVGNNFCSMWLPPKDSIRIHAKTDRVSIYLFRF